MTTTALNTSEVNTDRGMPASRCRWHWRFAKCAKGIDYEIIVEQGNLIKSNKDNSIIESSITCMECLKDMPTFCVESSTTWLGYLVEMTKSCNESGIVSLRFLEDKRKRWNWSSTICLECVEVMTKCCIDVTISRIDGTTRRQTDQKIPIPIRRPLSNTYSSNNLAGKRTLTQTTAPDGTNNTILWDAWIKLKCRYCYNILGKSNQVRA
jgi:hypothetical protein